MHPSLARRFILVVSLMALLFTLDAAFESRLAPSYLLGLIVLGLGLAWLLVQLGGVVLTGTHRQRHSAIVGLNMIGGAPPVAVLAVIDAVNPLYVSRVMAVTVVWFALVLLWTTLVLRHAAHQSAAAAAPRPHPPYRPSRRQANAWRATRVKRARAASAG